MYCGKLVFESDEQEFSLKEVKSKKTSRQSFEDPHIIAGALADFVARTVPAFLLAHLRINYANFLLRHSTNVKNYVYKTQLLKQLHPVSHNCR